MLPYRSAHFITILLLCSLAPTTTASASLSIVLRYDDFTSTSNIEVERALFEAGKRVGANVLVGIIPFSGQAYPAEGLTAEKIAPTLSAEKQVLLHEYLSQGRVDLAVHGYNHRSNAQGAGNSEFAGISEVMQTRLAHLGKMSLDRILDTDIVSFVPPYNQYDSATLSALEKNGYQFLSAGLDGPAPDSTNLRFLPGGPYPYKMTTIIHAALEQGHTDGLVVVTMHPYDFLETGRTLPKFRVANSQVSLARFERELVQLSQLPNIKFSSVSELLDEGVDLSGARQRANVAWNDSFITRYRLLPASFGLYPITAIYYAEQEASRLLNIQILVALSLYGAIFILLVLTTKTVLSKYGNQRVRICLGIAAVSGLAAIGAKSLMDGFYLTAAVGTVSCLGILVATLTFRPYSARELCTHQ